MSGAIITDTARQKETPAPTCILRAHSVFVLITTYPLACRVEAETGRPTRQELQQSPLLPRITMVGVAAAAGEVSKSNLKEIVADLTRELEHTERGSAASAASTESKCEDRDPLFVANLDGVPKKGSPGFGRWFLTVN